MTSGSVERVPLIAVQDVAVHYRRRFGSGDRHTHMALERVSFDLFAGDALGVVGRNGAGKSTLLRLLAGIIRPDRGRVVNRGCSVGMLSLQLGFDPDLCGRDNAIISGMLLGIPRRQVLERLDEIIAFSELESHIDDPLRTYSNGMRARLGFSVALQMRPDVLLIDEVLGVGDVAFNAKAQVAIRDIVRSERTVVLVSHSAAAVRTLCNRAVWIEEGVNRLEGSVADVMAAYEDTMGGIGHRV